jgi:hypothetical protein
MMIVNRFFEAAAVSPARRTHPGENSSRWERDQGRTEVHVMDKPKTFNDAFERAKRDAIQRAAMDPSTPSRVKEALRKIERDPKR